MFDRLFVAHPASVGESYGQHLLHSLSFAAAMFCGAMACLAHAFVPAICQRTGSGIVAGLYQRMIVARHPAGASPRE